MCLSAIVVAYTVAIVWNLSQKHTHTHVHAHTLQCALREKVFSKRYYFELVLDVEKKSVNIIFSVFKNIFK